MNKLLIFILGCASAILASCSAAYIPGLYRIDVQQGNVVTQEMLRKLEPGMSKKRVKRILGTPLLVETVYPDRWYYIYSFQPGGGRRKQRTIIAWFEEGGLSRLSGRVQPGVPEEAKKADRTVTVLVPPQPEEGGLLDSLADWFGLEDNASG